MVAVYTNTQWSFCLMMLNKPVIKVEIPAIAAIKLGSLI